MLFFLFIAFNHWNRFKLLRSRSLRKRFDRQRYQWIYSARDHHGLNHLDQHEPNWGRIIICIGFQFWKNFENKLLTTNERPMMVFNPVNDILESLISIRAVPDSSATIFPRSPTCLSSSSGAPWVLEWGLKCAPADVHPLVLSPNSWTEIEAIQLNLMLNCMQKKKKIMTMEAMWSGSQAGDFSSDMNAFIILSKWKSIKTKHTIWSMDKPFVRMLWYH